MFSFVQTVLRELVATRSQSCKFAKTICQRPNHMRRTATLLAVLLFAASAWAQEEKKTDDLKPADPDTGESTVEETTLGLLPQRFERWGIKFAATYIREVLGNPSGGLKRGSV